MVGGGLDFDFVVDFGGYGFAMGFDFGGINFVMGFDFSGFGFLVGWVLVVTVLLCVSILVVWTFQWVRFRWFWFCCGF